MKIYTSLLSILLIMLLASCSTTNKDCVVRDITGAMTDEQLLLLKADGYDWMRNAMVCRMGEFEISTPANNGENNSNIIFVFRKGKPVFYRSNMGTYIYSPKLIDASIEKIMVNIWHGGDDDDVNRIWYQTIGKNPEVMTYDTNFDGQPDLKTIYENNEIVEMYEWKNDKWHRKELKKIP
jgi:hypothetical protein